MKQSYNTKIITKRVERGVRPNTEYRINTKLHCSGGVDPCSVDGCDLYGIVTVEGNLLCYRHYFDKQGHQQHQGHQEHQQHQPRSLMPKSLLKKRPMAGTSDY